MSHVRPFEKEDLAAVAMLHAKVFCHSNGPAPQSLLSRFEEIFFQHPWFDQRILSLVYEESDGGIAGFLGVMPRPMSLDGTPIDAAIGTLFMVDPDCQNRAAALYLLEEFLSGPQDISIADEANDTARTVWEGLGGKTAYLYSLRWTRPLRPFEFFTSLALKGKRSGPPSWTVKPVSRVVDALVARMPYNPFRLEKRAFYEETLETDDFLHCLAEFNMNGAMQAKYDQRSVTWLLEILPKKASNGTLQRIKVCDDKGESVGFYIYYLKPGGVCQVVTVGASGSSFADVLRHLFDHAQRRGAVALSGRVAPQFLQEYSDNYCLINRGYNWMLVHSHKPELLQTIFAGEARLTRMDGEWWLPIIGEEFD